MGFSTSSCWRLFGNRICGFTIYAHRILEGGSIDYTSGPLVYSDETGKPSEDKQTFDCPEGHVLVGLKGMRLRDRFDYEPLWVGSGQVYKMSGVCAKVQPKLQVMTPGPVWNPPLEATPNGNQQQATVLKEDRVEGPTEARYSNRLNP
jgi:hypothetical protein